MLVDLTKAVSQNCSELLAVWELSEKNWGAGGVRYLSSYRPLYIH